MASFEPIDFDPNAPPPRPDTPPVRRSFILILLILLFAVTLVYGIPYMAEQIGYRYEVGRARAATEALEQLDEDEVIQRASALFRLASTKVQPAVVNVRTSRLTLPQDFQNNQGPMRLPLGAGSGVVIDKDRGYVVTNYHVIKDADRVSVRLGRRELDARVVGSDEKTDLAVLQVEGRLDAEASWGDSNKVDIGDWVLAIGNPYEFDRTVTAGIVSATGRGNLPLFPNDFYQDFIQTDAAINPGNSGGPLIDLNGDVIGINTAIVSEDGGHQGIGLAISSTLARQVVEQLIEEGRVIRGYIGVTVRDVGPNEFREIGLKKPEGAWVETVLPGGPADRAGLRPGDIVLAIDGEPIKDMNALRTRTFTLPVEESVPVRILRNGEEQELDVTIDAMPVLLDLGLFVSEFRLEDLDPELLERLPDRPERLLIIQNVQPGTPADRAGLQRGLRLTGVFTANGTVPVDTLEELNELAAARYNPQDGLTLQIETPDGQAFPVNIGGPQPGVRLP